MDEDEDEGQDDTTSTNVNEAGLDLVWSAKFVDNGTVVLPIPRTPPLQSPSSMALSPFRLAAPSLTSTPPSSPSVYCTLCPPPNTYTLLKYYYYNRHYGRGANSRGVKTLAYEGIEFTDDKKERSR